MLLILIWQRNNFFNLATIFSNLVTWAIRKFKFQQQRPKEIASPLPITKKSNIVF